MGRGAFVFHPAPRLVDVAHGRDNNFNLLRLIAASGVLFSHAFALTLAGEEPFWNWLGFSLSHFSLVTFFGISGFLIARSMERSDLKRFIAARALRLFPGLLVVLVLTAFVAGPLLTEASPESYWPAAPVYVLRNLSLYFLQYPLPGIFAENPHGPAINGSLWTLNHEMTCYIAVAVAGVAGILKQRSWMAIALAVFVVGYVFIRVADPHPRLQALASLALPFAMGVALHVWSDRVRLSVGIGVLLVAVAVALRETPLLDEAVAAATVYAVLLAAYLPAGQIRKFNRLGDFSYGVYIYAFPVQQFMVAQFGPMSAAENMMLSFPVTLAFAALSWNLVEKPALGLVRGRGRAAAASKSVTANPIS